MNTVERVKKIASEKGIPLYKIEQQCGFANGYIGGLRKGNIPEDRLQKIAKVLETPVDFLRSGEINEGHYLDDESAKLMQKLFESPSKHLVAKAIADMSEEQAKVFADFVEGMTRVDYHKDYPDA